MLPKDANITTKGVDPEFDLGLHCFLKPLFKSKDRYGMYILPINY